jgi:hypothetical protein
MITLSKGYFSIQRKSIWDGWTIAFHHTDIVVDLCFVGEGNICC